ncbi:bifunctional nitrilase/nitrile hydratase NIT4-like isoform X1 [Triticum urartu]|uniref:CN hydrolase domain-containing protein n=1 Tax=Triticum urartu TaxID=4572 RepID=A0A8R7QWZ8_TRIUA|nr:bifunctional nitrilase/nitrile hydratase NIT4-like isoform X1 [Triticum urartu]XP_048536307.1 bifunctional nitrilase/nitrile hydratase NIT4-like isoform X1 [Triticum urartu]
MPLPPMSSGVGPVIAEVEMNAGADQDATTVWATVVQACSMFYDTLATFDKAEKLTAETAGYGSQLVLFPEVFVGGYPHGSAFGLTVGSRSAKGKEDFWKYHTAAINVPERTAVRPGGSSIISPSMAVLAGPNYEGEALLTADQDIGEIVRAKFDFDAVGNYKRAEVPSLSVNTDAVGHCKRA